MKKLLILSLLAVGVSAKAQAIPLTNNVTLSWGYPLPVPTNMNFVISQSTNLAASWTVLTNTPSSNCAPVITATSASFSLGLPVVPGAWYFIVQASNLWGISSNSNILLTPPAAINPTNFTIAITP